MQELKVFLVIAVVIITIICSTGCAELIPFDPGINLSEHYEEKQAELAEEISRKA